MKKHLYRPGEALAMCGRKSDNSTHNPLEITCATCGASFQNNIMWYWRLRTKLWHEGVIDRSGELRRKDNVLWTGSIPVVSDFDFNTVSGRAVAYAEDGFVRIEITLDPEQAKQLQETFENHIPRALTWYTQLKR